MSSTPRHTPSSGRPSFPSPQQSDPQFAQFLQHVCLPLGPLHARLSAMQTALGKQPAPDIAQAWQDLLMGCHRLELQLNEVDSQLLESYRMLEGLLQLMNADHAAAIQPCDQYLMLQHLHNLLTRTLAALHRTE